MTGVGEWTRVKLAVADTDDELTHLLGTLLIMS